MLIQLGIRDLAVVETLDLEFGNGLTVLTGETGAGKSILMTALGLALGGRADSGFIRPGATRSEINLVFDLSDSSAAKSWLEENEYAEGGDCVIRRILTQDGRSRAFINGRPATIQAMQELGSFLVEIHGQHAHVHLLKSAEQRRIVDEAAGNQELLAEAESLCRRWHSLNKELARRAAAAKDQAAREEMLRFQWHEMDQYEITELDYAAIVEEHTLQANIGEILETVCVQLERLYENEHHSVNANLGQAVNALTDLCELAPEFAESVALLKEAQVGIREAASDLRHRSGSLEVDPQRLEWLEQRLADFHHLARKYRIRPEELPAYRERLKEELQRFAQTTEASDSLACELKQISAHYRRVAERLTECRKTAGTVLQNRISSLIRELGISQGQMFVEVISSEQREPTPQGEDQVGFFFSANPGLPPRPLAKVASGGELSRIGLAIQVAVTDSKQVSTLIFDEVDTGIGGGIAEIVGQKLRFLGEQQSQVFCVTHLAQVAVQGHQHLLVEKSTRPGGSAHTLVRSLNGADRIAEVARMIGGLHVTPQTIAHAEEMLNLRAPVAK